MAKLKKNDEVIVITGKDKGNVGTIEQIIGDQVIIEGINMVQKHVKPDPNKGITGGRTDKSMPLHISNVRIHNLDTKRADRIGFRFDDQGVKQRVYKSSGKPIDDN